MKTTGKYQRRHYEDMARILKGSKSKGEIRKKLEGLFKRDNPRFDASRFRKASRKSRKKKR